MTRNELIKGGYLTWNENWELLHRKWRVDIWCILFYRKAFKKPLTFKSLRDTYKDNRTNFIQIDCDRVYKYMYPKKKKRK